MTTRREWLGLAGALLLLVIGFSLATDHFFSWTTMVALANQAPEALLLATGMTLVVLTGGIDLSVGSVLALSAATFGTAVGSGTMGLEPPPAPQCWWAQDAGRQRMAVVAMADPVVHRHAGDARDRARGDVSGHRVPDPLSWRARWT